MIFPQFSLSKMTLADDFAAYERLAASCMKSQDYYNAAELSELIQNGIVSAWWTKDATGIPVGWSGIYYNDELYPGANCFLGVIVRDDLRHTMLAMRLIRHAGRQAGLGPMTVYIQPGISTEKLVKNLGFRQFGQNDIWCYYICENNPFLRP